MRCTCFNSKPNTRLKSRKRKRKAPTEFNDRSQRLLMKDCDDCAVEARWAKCKQILHPAIGETPESFKGFIVSKPFTGKTLHICTRNKKVGVIQGGSWTEWRSICSPAVCSYGSMLSIEDNLAEHRSLTSSLSLSRCGFGLFFYSFFSLAILITQATSPKCFFCEREQLLSVYCRRTTKMACQRKQTRDWQRPIVWDNKFHWTVSQKLSGNYLCDKLRLYGFVKFSFKMTNIIFDNKGTI